MKNIFKKLSLAALVLTAASPAVAQTEEEPIITFHTNLYDLNGASNSFTFYLGSTEDTYVDVDCGFGKSEVEVTVAEFSTDTSTIQGTPVTCSVNRDGLVKVYGDPKLIDFIDMEGCYISSIEWPKLTEVDILCLNHNQLESLDLSHMTKLRALYLNDNPFTEATPVVVGADKPELTILEMSMIDWVSPEFNLSDYPELRAFTAYSCPSLRNANTSGCPKLLQLSIDGSSVEKVDVSKNPALLILNVSETRVTELDLSHNPYLTELYCQHEAVTNNGYKIEKLELGNNTQLQRLYAAGNNISDIDLSKLSKLTSLSFRHNRLSKLSLDGCPNASEIDISYNNMDYATLPVPKASYYDYIYQQNPFTVNRSYKEGSVLDLTDRVMREGSVTVAALYGVNRDNPNAPELLDENYYTFDNGKITLLKEYGDSMYVRFQNTMFPDCILTTTRFMVKNEADFGKPSASVSLPTSVLAKQQDIYIGFEGATEENPVKFSVDFGNGQLQEFTATTSSIPSEPNVKGQRAGARTIIYVEEGTDITALKLDGLRLNGPLDLSTAPMIRELKINNCMLPSIDLTWNRCLTMLDLSHNNLTNVNLGEPNSEYIKTQLGDINLSDNKISELKMVDNYGIFHVNVANNRLTEFNLTHATRLVDLDVSGNLLTELTIKDCELLETLDMSGNMISELIIPDYIPLKKLDLSGNSFSIPSLPLTSVCADYVYAPQRDITIPTKAPSINISSQYVEIDGEGTRYEWLKAADNTPVAEGDITSKSPGRFIFSNPAIGDIYCSMTHPAFPALTGENALKTTTVTTAEKPTNVFMTMETSADGTANMSIAANENNATIYIDWTGEGDLEQYVLKNTYTVFNASVKAGVNVKCYSYEENDGVTVFSISAPLKSIDASGLKSARMFGLSGYQIEADKIVLPPCENLQELTLNGLGLTEQPDLTGFVKLRSLNLNANKLTSLDLTKVPSLETVYASNNGLTEVKFNNPKMWEAMLGGNDLEEIDLAGVPAMAQLWLSSNKLTHIDISPLKSLKVLWLDGNRFDFTTLPLPQSSFILYNYLNQAPLEVASVNGVVDLSSQAEVNGTATEYTWFIGAPYIDENGNLAGEDLYIDEEYTLENGVTTFLKPFDNIMCVMTNSLFPNLYMMTGFLNTEAAGVEDVEADTDNGEAVYYNLQGVRVQNPANGIYIRRQGNTVTKVLVK